MSPTRTAALKGRPSAFISGVWKHRMSSSVSSLSRRCARRFTAFRRGSPRSMMVEPVAQRGVEAGELLGAEASIPPLPINRIPQRLAALEGHDLLRDSGDDRRRL